MPQSRLNFHLPFTVQVHLCIEAIRICSGWVGLTDTVPHRMSFISGFRNVLKRVCMYVWGIHRCSAFFFLSLHFFGGLNNCQDGNCRTFLKTVHLSHVWNIHFAFVGVGIMVFWSWTTLIQFAGMAGKRNGQCTSSQPITQSTSHTLIH